MQVLNMVYGLDLVKSAPQTKYQILSYDKQIILVNLLSLNMDMKAKAQLRISVSFYRQKETGI